MRNPLSEWLTVHSWCCVGKKDLRKKSRNHDNRLSKREFRDLVYKVVDNMAGGNEHFDYFIDFLFNSVEVRMLNSLQ